MLRKRGSGIALYSFNARFILEENYDQDKTKSQTVYT